MTLRIGRTTLLVHDVDEAVAFYVDKLGFSLLPDEHAGSATWAALAGPGSVGDAALWFIPTTAGDNVGDQADGAPLITLYTDDFAAELIKLQDKGVEVTKSPGRPEAFIHDLYGNQIVLLQQPSK